MEQEIDWQGEYTDVIETMVSQWCTEEWAVERLKWIADISTEKEWQDAANMTLEEINNGEWKF